MRKISTHWEVRRRKWHSSSQPPEVERFDDEAPARARALTLALADKDSGYMDEVKLVEVETHEEVHESYSRASAASALTPPRAAPERRG